MASSIRKFVTDVAYSTLPLKKRRGPAPAPKGGDAAEASEADASTTDDKTPEDSKAAAEEGVPSKKEGGGTKRPLGGGESDVPKKKELESVFIHVPPGQQLGLALELSEGKGAEIKGIKPVCPISGKVHVGDIIVAIDGKPITSRKDFGVGTGRFRVFQIDREATDWSNVPIIDVKKRRKMTGPKRAVFIPVGIKGE